jgi:N-acyl-D-aspartate/D-glutamate deacylase
VHKATGKPAARLGLTDRGVLAVGKAADIVVFDPAELRDNATYAQPLRPPSGIRHVLVAGESVVDSGRPTGARPGQLLRRG